MSGQPFSFLFLLFGDSLSQLCNYKSSIFAGILNNFEFLLPKNVLFLLLMSKESFLLIANVYITVESVFFSSS